MQNDRPWQLCGSEEVRPFQIAGYINSPQKLDGEILGAYDSRPEMADDCCNIFLLLHICRTRFKHMWGCWWWSWCWIRMLDDGAKANIYVYMYMYVYILYIYIIYPFLLLSLFLLHYHHVAHYLFLSTSLVIIRYKWWLQRAPGGVLVLRTPATL